MYKYIVIDSEYCSMGRWIAAIVANVTHKKVYEGKDLLKLIPEDGLSKVDLQKLDEQLAKLSLEEMKNSEELKKIHASLSKAMNRALDLGPCIIHERAATEILKDRKDCLKVLLYNTNMEHRILRARKDKTYSLSALSNPQIIDFINLEDAKRRRYHNAVATTLWGEKETYDICLDSDILSREKCAEILIEALQDISLDLEECSKSIEKAFGESK